MLDAPDAAPCRPARRQGSRREAGDAPVVVSRIRSREPDKFLNVTCITRKRNAIYQAFFSQFPPSESSVLRGVGQEGRFFTLLTVEHGMKGVLEVSLPEATPCA